MSWHIETSTNGTRVAHFCRANGVLSAVCKTAKLPLDAAPYSGVHDRGIVPMCEGCKTWLRTAEGGCEKEFISGRHNLERSKPGTPFIGLSIREQETLRGQ